MHSSTMEDFDRNDSFGMDDDLGDDFFEDSGDLDRIFDDDDDDTNPLTMNNSSGHSNSKGGGSKGPQSSSTGDEKRGFQIGDMRGGPLGGVKDGKDDGESSDDSTNHTRRRCNSGASYEGDRSGPAPDWHSGAADKPHREAMIREM